MATMAVDNRQQAQLNGLGYDPMRQGYAVPAFSNPWANANPTTVAGSSQSHMYPTSQPEQHRPASMALPVPSLAATASPVQQGTYHLTGSYSTSPIDTSQGYVPQYSAAGSTSSYVPTSAPQYTMDYRTAAYGSYDAARRPSNSLASNPREAGFMDAVKASQGMLALGSSDITPRPLYGSGSARSSTDSYGFPTTHSAHSSISSASSYPQSYYNPSVAESVASDYSSASESVDFNSRVLPRPMSMIGASGISPPAPQSMMGQFSSKVSSSTQKKHKCKICDKRFTRPSSLQTHMYSHTGEKPFACDVEGCGRHFSVVSNLRRHRKVHKNDGTVLPGSPEEES